MDMCGCEKTYAAAECVRAFCEKMNEKAAGIGMTGAAFHDPAGIGNFASARDILRLLVHASGYEAIYDIWNTPRYVAKLKGPNAREMELVSKTVAGDASPYLTDHYRVMGGKGGTLTRYKAFSTAVLVEVPGSDDWLACVVMYADEPNDQPKNRFAAAKQAVDAALIKYYDKDADNSSASVCAANAAVCRLPVHNPRAYAHAELPLLYEKAADEVKMPASMSKLLTTILTLEYAPLHDRITVTQEDIDLLQSGFYVEDLKPGDVLTVKDALYALLLPSSNSAAFVLGRFVGEKILAECEG